MQSKINWQWRIFNELTVGQLYDLLALREQVFGFEQHCTEIDHDGLDKQAVHLLGELNGELIAYARILPPGVYKQNAVSFGRLVVALKMRGQGLGKQLMQQILPYIHQHYPNVPIKFSAQLYLQKFYQSFGFQPSGEVYDEAGIPHIAMHD